MMAPLLIPPPLLDDVATSLVAVAVAVMRERVVVRTRPMAVEVVRRREL